VPLGRPRGRPQPLANSRIPTAQEFCADLAVALRFPQATPFTTSFPFQRQSYCRWRVCTTCPRCPTELVSAAVTFSCLNDPPPHELFHRQPIAGDQRPIANQTDHSQSWNTYMVGDRVDFGPRIRLSVGCFTLSSRTTSGRKLTHPSRPSAGPIEPLPLSSGIFRNATCASQGPCPPSQTASSASVRAPRAESVANEALRCSPNVWIGLQSVRYDFDAPVPAHPSLSPTKAGNIRLPSPGFAPASFLRLTIAPSGSGWGQLSQHRRGINDRIAHEEIISLRLPHDFSSSSSLSILAILPILTADFSGHNILMISSRSITSRAKTESGA
jgi:hypothetical protein